MIYKKPQINMPAGKMNKIKIARNNIRKSFLFHAVSDSMISCCPTIFLPHNDATEDQINHIEFVHNQNAAWICKHDVKELQNLMHEILSNKTLLLKIKNNLKQLNRNNGAENAAKVIASHC
ncbi:MAG: hypothetical protein ABII90_15840 [Bacteroidota bacterium]